MEKKLSRRTGRKDGVAVYPNRLVFSALLACVAVGCATQKVAPFAAKSETAPTPVYCFDSVGHTPGSKPFLMGGSCCCTPTQELMNRYHKDGLLKEMQLKDLLALYEQKGIKTALDHKGCNNLCQWGPHVIKGGQCMAPPTPATFNFEEVRFGMRYVPAEPVKEKGKK